MSHRRYCALLIANSTFPNDPHNLPDLEGPRNDPALLRDALCDDRYGLFPTDNVRLVPERTMAEVLEETETFLHSAHRDDTLLLYYSGHGRLDPGNELYLCTRNSRVDRLRSSAVPASHLSAMIDDSAAAITVLVLDCCHSGAFKGGSFADKLTGRGRFVLSSCRTGELANDSAAANHASLFTHHFVRGMLGEATDQNNDGYLDLDDLYTYVHSHLTTEGRQIPERRFAGTGAVPMARCRGRAGGRDLDESSDRETTHDPGDGNAANETTAVNPPAAEPILDVSPTEIFLEDVEVGQVLPPHKVAVVNRGGGTLTWSAECRSEWMTLQLDKTGLLIHIRPPYPGTHRAVVQVRHGSDQTKTVHVSVRAIAPATRTRAAHATPGARPAVLPDWRWKLWHSLWLLTTLPMGLTTWAGFLYVGLRAKRWSWIWTAVVYGVVTLALFVWMFAAPTDADGNIVDTWQANVGVAVTLILWFGGTLHCLIVNVGWLKWLAGRRRTPPQWSKTTRSSQPF